MSEEKRWARHERKQKREKAVGKLIKNAGDFFGVDRFFETNFSRDFSKAKALEQSKEYLRPQEFKDPDEHDLFEKLKATFESDTKDELEECEAYTNADKEKLRSDFIDPHWGHTTGQVQGRLEINRIENLHEDLRVGLFKKVGSYDVFGRPNYLYDPKLPIAINRLSLKVKLPEAVNNEYTTEDAKELDLLLSEGLPVGIPGQPDGQGFFFRDARQLLMANEMKNGLLSVAEVLLDGKDAEVCRYWKEVIFKKNTDMLYQKPQTQRAWFQKWFYSAGPYALGDGVMKFALEPELSELGKPISIFDHPATDHAEAFKNFSADNTEIRFTLKVQVATEVAIKREDGDPPKCVMAAEYTDIAWDTDVAPFVPIGTLILSPHQSDATDPKNRFFAVPFNAWNTYHEMRPLGQLFRARREVHKHHRTVRLQHSFGEYGGPPQGKCPFS